MMDKVVCWITKEPIKRKSVKDIALYYLQRLKAIALLMLLVISMFNYLSHFTNQRFIF